MNITAIPYALIVLVHTLLYLNGHGTLDISGYVQLIPPELLGLGFWKGILYFHSHPPGLTLLTYLLHVISFGNEQAAFALVLTFLHCLSFRLFLVFLKQIHFPRPRVIALILFLNPLMFLYFRYPFYPPLLFAVSCGVLAALFSSWTLDRKLIVLALLFSLNAFFRSTWHFYLVLVFLAWFWMRASRRAVLISLLFLLLPFSVYMKNAVTFGRFTASTWLGFHLARHHIPPDAPRRTISNIPLHSGFEEYEAYIDESWVYHYRNIPILNDTATDMLKRNNVRSIMVEDGYYSDVRDNFNLKYSLGQAWKGLVKLMDSPARTDDFTARDKNPSLGPVPMDDIFEWPVVTQTTLNPHRLLSWFSDEEEPGQRGTRYVFRLSAYKLVYPLVVCLLLMSWRRFSFEWHYLLGLTLIFTLIYAVVDQDNASRCRFEIEPFYYALFCAAFLSVQRAFFRKETE